MKTTIGVLALVGVVLAIIVSNSESVKYVKGENTVEVKTQEVNPEWMTIEDEDAKKAYQDVIHKKELEAELKAKDVAITEAEEAVKKLKEERKALTTELTAY